MLTDVDALVEMGFPLSRAQRALAKTGYKGVKLAMDWLFAHDDDPNIDEPFEAPTGHLLGEEEEVPADNSAEKSKEDSQTECAESGAGAQELEEKTLKYDECDMRHEIDVQAHAERTQHASFSESTEEIRQLTEEEKTEHIKTSQKRLKQKQLEKEEDKKEMALKEKIRRGPSLAKQRKQFLDESETERKRATRLKKEKEDDPTPKSPSATASASGAPSSHKEYMYPDYKLKIRLTNGEILSGTFGPREPLSAVRLFVEINRTDGTGPFSLMTYFPRKVFTSDDMEMPLIALALRPTGVLTVTKLTQRRKKLTQTSSQ